jgi:hypothetical protein
MKKNVILCHVWTPPALQEFSADGLPRSGAVMCPAC